MEERYIYAKWIIMLRKPRPEEKDGYVKKERKYS
jgi:hypothetical protein